MLYRRLGRTNLRVSELGFGAARGYDRDDFTALVHAILDSGINFIDTATGYGDSELALGLIEQGKLDLAPLVTHDLPLERYDEGTALLESRQAIKVCYWPWDSP